jgi:hypothetical protein
MQDIGHQLSVLHVGCLQMGQKFEVSSLVVVLVHNFLEVLNLPFVLLAQGGLLSQVLLFEPKLFGF